MSNLLINRLGLAAFLVFSFAFAVAAQETKRTKPVVMILGSYHMANPGRDLNNIAADDVRAAKRQKEIADFIAVLKKFKPTRIAVEQPLENAAKLNARYGDYLSGKYELSANEVDQLGFRLAKEMNLKEVSSIDVKGDFDFDKVAASAKANDEIPFADAMMTSGKTEVGKIGEMMKTATVTELLAYMNDAPTVERWHQVYLKIARVGAGKDYAGAGLAGDWYARNLKIYANLTRLAAAPNERILVIYGAGHLKTLQEFVEQSGEFELERLEKYL